MIRRRSAPTFSRNETVIVLPDTSEMVAEVKVNEALSGSINEGQRAVITSDAHPDSAFGGTVLGVGVLAEGGSWRDPNRRDYTVRILIDGENTAGLKPSMRCKADIQLGAVSNAVYVPVMAIFRNGPMAFVYVPDGNGYAQRRVELGESSELYVEVLSGLEEGETVLLTAPEATEVTSTLEVPDMMMSAPSGPKMDTSESRSGSGDANRSSGGGGTSWWRSAAEQFGRMTGVRMILRRTTVHRPRIL